MNALRSKDAELSRELEGMGTGETQSLEGHECALTDNNALHFTATLRNQAGQVAHEMPEVRRAS